MNEKIKDVLDRLSKSRFRSGFHLKIKMYYILKIKELIKLENMLMILYLRELLILLMLLMENKRQ